MIPPTPANAAKYQAWATSGRAGRQYLGAELDNNVVFTCLKAGTVHTKAFPQASLCNPRSGLHVCHPACFQRLMHAAVWATSEEEGWTRNLGLTSIPC